MTLNDLDCLLAVANREGFSVSALTCGTWQKYNWVVFGNQHAVTSLFYSPVMTFTASCFRRGAIDWVEGLMTTGTREFTLKVARHSWSTADPLHMKRVKLFAAPLIIAIRGQPGDLELF